MENDEDFRNENSAVEIEREMIENAIHKHGFSELLEDKTIDMVAAIVANKLKHVFVRPPPVTKPISGEQSFEEVLKQVSLILGIVFMAFIIYSMYTSDSQMKSAQTLQMTNSDAGGDSNKKTITFPESSNSLVVGNFEFKRGSIAKLEDYSGRDDIIKEHVHLIETYLEQIKRNSKKELDKMNCYTKQNFLLEGPPGTGKTLFVRKILTDMDIILKKKFILNNEKVDPALKQKYLDAAEKPEEQQKIINSIPSRVLYCEVSPSSINNKYVGESERNVGILFQTANTLAKEYGYAVFLFFDEGDVFFEERSGSSSGNTGAGNVKSELLQRIGVMPLEYYSVFVYCATNRIKAFDDAFKRRFGRQDKFDYPSEGDRKKLIEFLLSDFEGIDSVDLNQIAALTAGRSQAYISNMMKSFYISEDWRISGFDLQGYAEYLAKNKRNKNLG